MPRWRRFEGMAETHIIVNGERVETALPVTIENFLISSGLLPRSVVVEQNGEAVAPSEFAGRELRAGDRIEVVRIVAGG
jgi:thiamine biosynthesis protein ThiS